VLGPCGAIWATHVPPGSRERNRLQVRASVRVRSAAHRLERILSSARPRTEAGSARVATRARCTYHELLRLDSRVEGGLRQLKDVTWISLLLLAPHRRRSRQKQQPKGEHCCSAHPRGWALDRHGPDEAAELTAGRASVEYPVESHKIAPTQLASNHYTAAAPGGAVSSAHIPARQTGEAPTHAHACACCGVTPELPSGRGLEPCFSSWASVAGTQRR